MINRTNNCRIQLLMFAILALLSVACQKNEPEPPLADQILGSYTVTSYKSGNASVNLPATTTTGITVTAKITSTKVSDDVASFTFIFTQTKSGIASSSNSKLNDVSLKKGSNGAIEGSIGMDGISWQNNQLTLTFGDADPAEVLTIYGKKD
ncbi:hypothetical protein GVN20_20400 [Runella sp. CRIBMP]|uniref:Lipocalin-like domain-containing protein n=1 Tax=Runella aurantiaca TaxID=2282308 RepID=A0A369I7X9_9BACT|nr:MULTISPECIES: hypothetical protein [Runella]NBB21737.1 hypothetical protein [Runella sp. CRIBMP]RDB05718.1 hypothetical protein DVG78_12040 [Runella aurantiaca]